MKFLTAAFLMSGLAACMPTEQITVTQESITEAKENLEENLSAGITATAEAISETVDTVKETLTGGEDEVEAEEEVIEVAAIEEEEEVITPPSLDPSSFLGQSRENLTAALGVEDYHRHDQGVEVLQFRMASCIIDFVLNEDQRVTSLHRRHRMSGENYDEVSCRLDLAARRDGLQ